jgi:hypothetical protein
MNSIAAEMSTMRPWHKRNDPSRRILAMAIALLVLGGVLLVLSFILGANPRLQPVGMGFRQAAPYALLIGFGLLVVYAVLRPDPEAGSRPRNEPTLFGKDSTDFVSYLDRGANEDPTVPPQHRR